MKKQMILTVVVLTTLAFGACGDRPDRFEMDPGLVGPVAFGDGGVFLAANIQELLLVRPDSGDSKALELDRFPVGEEPVLLGLAGDDTVLVWSREDKTLDRISADDGASETYELDTAFSGFHRSPEGRYLVATVTEQDTGDDLFINSGQLAVVDLESAPTADNPRFLSVPSYGGTPRRVDISPAINHGGEARQLAFVSWNSYVTLVDVRKPDLEFVAVPLRPEGTDADIIPQKMKFHVKDDSVVNAYFIGAGTADLYEISVDLELLSSHGSEGVSINLIPTAPGPVDFDVFMGADGKMKVITICSSRRIVLSEPEISESTELELAITPTGLSMFEMPGMASGLNERFAAVWSNSSSTYYLVELEHFLTKKGKALHPYVAPAPVSGMEEVPGQLRFLLYHNSGGSAISVASMTDGSVISISNTGAMEQRLMRPEEGKLYALTKRGGSRYLVALELSDITARVVQLDGYTGATASMIYLEDLAEILVFIPGENRLIRAPTSFSDRDDLTDFPFFLMDGLMDL